LDVTLFSYIVLAFFAIAGAIAALFLLSRVRRLMLDSNLKEKLKAQTGYMIGAIVLYLLLSSLAENYLESRFVSESFNYREEAGKIGFIVFMTILFFAQARGVVQSNLPKQWKTVLVAGQFSYLCFIFMIFILVYILKDSYW